MKKVGIIGSGIVGQTLAKGFMKYGYSVMIGTQDADKQANLVSNTGARAGTFSETATFGEMIVLCVKGAAAEEALALCGGENLANKTIIDATNPIKAAPAVNGVLQFFTTMDESLMERLQKRFPDGHFVKAFNSVGNAFMVDPDFGGILPTMFICGNHEPAKKEVTAILSQFGWETEDMGMVEAARAIEPLCMLWCIPGFVQNSWTHAFKLLKK